MEIRQQVSRIQFDSLFEGAERFVPPAHVQIEQGQRVPDIRWRSRSNCLLVQPGRGGQISLRRQFGSLPQFLLQTAVTPGRELIHCYGSELLRPGAPLGHHDSGKIPPAGYRYDILDKDEIGVAGAHSVIPFPHVVELESAIGTRRFPVFDPSFLEQLDSHGPPGRPSVRFSKNVPLERSELDRRHGQWENQTGHRSYKISPASNMNLLQRNRPSAQALIVGLMIVLSLASYVNRTAMSIASRDLIKEFHLSETEMGSIFSAFLLSYALLMPEGGRLADRLGPRRVLTGATFGAGLFSIVTAGVGVLVTASPLLAFQAVRLALGAFTAPLYPACARMNANWMPPHQRARVQGLILSGAPLGSAITPLLLVWLMSHFGWRWSFCLIGLGTMVVALVWWALARDSYDGRTDMEPEPQTGDWWRAWKVLFSDRNLMLLSFSYFSLNYFEYIFFYWIYYYFGEIRRVSPSESAIYTSVLLLSMMVAMPAAGWFSDRLIPLLGRNRSRRYTAVGGMALSAGLLYLGTNAAAGWWMVALLALALGCAASAEGPSWATAIEAGGEHAGAASGIMNGIGNIGGLLAPVVTPFVAQRAGWAAGLYVGSAVVFVGALAWLFIHPKEISPAATAE